MNPIIEKLKVYLGIAKGEFAKVKLEDGTEYSIEKLEVGVDVIDSEGNVVADGEYKLEDGTVIVVTEGKIAEIRKADEMEEANGGASKDQTEDGAGPKDDPTTTDAEKTDEEGNAVVIITNQDGREIKFTLKEGAPVTKTNDGEYTDKGGKYIITVKGGKVESWRLTEDATKTTTTETTTPAETSVEDRIAALEAWKAEAEKTMSEMYEIIMALTKKMDESTATVTETVEEFKKIKSQPSAQPLQFGSEENKPMSRLEKLKALKNQ